MALQHKFRRGLTASEVSVIISGLDEFYYDLSDAKRGIAHSQSLITNLGDLEEDCGQTQWHEELLEEAIQIEKALFDEIKIAYCNLDRDSGYYDVPRTNQKTRIEIFSECRHAPDDEYAFYPIFEHTEITKISIAKWLQEFMPEKSIIFDPTKSYLMPDESDFTSNNETDLEADDTPDNLYHALSVFRECWKDLPLGMKKPTKKQLTKYIEKIGINNTKIIDAIITLSAPENEKFGGNQSHELDEWKPLGERKV